MRGMLKKAVLVTVTLGVCLAASAATAPRINGEAPSYRIKLDRFVVSPNRFAGLLVRARINGGPMLRLLVDSGSQYVVLNRRAALSSHCAGGSDFELIGAGAPAALPATLQTAETLELGDLTLRGVPLIVAGRTFADGIQGVLPLSILSGFLIRLDFPGKELDLLPYPPREANNAGAVPILPSTQLLFVKGTVNETRTGYFLLDTGAVYTAISHNLAEQLHIPDILAAHVPLRGGVADIDAPLLSGSVRVQIGSHRVTGPVVAVDLSTVSRYHGLEISGLLGYSALCDSVLIANYRDGLVRIEPK